MKKLSFLLALTPTLVLASCLGDVMEIFCETGPDSDHCYQAAAVQDAQPETCEKIEGKDFNKVSGNAPKDKCYLMIGENTGDPSVCANIEGGLISYSQEECEEGAMRGRTVEDCVNAADEMKCRSAWAAKGKGCGEGYKFEQGACVVPKTPDDKGADDDIESKVEADLKTMKDAATGKYMDLLTQSIEDEEDDAKKKGLEAYKEFLEKGGETLETVQTTADQLAEIKKIFLDSYDPSMDIDKMPVNKLLDPGLFDKIKSRIFGEDEQDARGKAEDSLTVYEAMLKRQTDIDFLQKGRMDRLKETVVSKVKDKAVDALKESVEGAVKAAAGEAFGAIAPVKEALDSFQEAAQKEMFIGLAAAYNRQRDSIAAANPNLSPEEIHKRTVDNVKANPYEDVPNAGFVKYGNLLENKDCNDESNPLCIDNRVFWTAMDKTYQYANKKK